MEKKNTSIYDKLDNLKAPIDKEQMWSNIHNREGFPQQEKKRRFFLWFFLGLGLAVLITSLAIRMNSSSQVPIEQATAQPNLTTAQTHEALKSTSSEEKNMGLHAAETKTGAALKATEREAKSELKTAIDLEIKTENKNQIQRKKQSKTVETIPTETAAATNEFNRTKNISPSAIAPKQQALDNESNSSNDLAILQSRPSTPSTASAALPHSILLKELNNRQSKRLPFLKNQLALLPTLAFSDITLFDNLAKVLLPEDSTTETPINHPKLWAMEMGVGMGTGQHSITADALWEEQAFQREHTKSFISYMLDLRLSRKLKYNFHLAAGLRYANNSRLFSYQDISKVYTKQERPDAANPANYFEATSNTSYTFYHQHHTLDVEAMLIKDFTWKKTTAYAGLGLGLNTLHRFQGKGINAQLEAIDLQAAGDYKDNIGWHYLYEVGVAQQLNAHYYVSAAVSGKSGQDLNSRGSHRFAPLYLRVGVGRRF